MKHGRASRALSEGIGTAFLLMGIVGSGIMGERLSAGNDAITLLVNSLATGAMLTALILSFASISGAHFNPVVTIVQTLRRKLPWPDALVYILVQLIGACLGTIGANLMFSESAIELSTKTRSANGLLLAEGIATFGLLLIILTASKKGDLPVALAVGLFIGAGLWFTSSTAFANPAVTLARSLTDTYTGIRLSSVPWFIAAQFLGGGLAGTMFQWLDRARSEPSSD